MRTLVLIALFLFIACSQPEPAPIQEINPRENVEPPVVPPSPDEFGEAKPSPTPKPKVVKKLKKKHGRNRPR